MMMLTYEEAFAIADALHEALSNPTIAITPELKRFLNMVELAERRSLKCR